MDKLTEQRTEDRACTICNGLVAFGGGVRAVSKKRCDDCKNGSHWGLSPTDWSRGVPINWSQEQWRSKNDRA